MQQAKNMHSVTRRVSLVTKPAPCVDLHRPEATSNLILISFFKVDANELQKKKFLWFWHGVQCIIHKKSVHYT